MPEPIPRGCGRYPPSVPPSDAPALLSFDPSSRATGWALMPLSGDLEPVAGEAGVLKYPDAWPAWLRVRALREGALSLLDRLSGRFDRVVVEVPGSAQAGRYRGSYATPGVYAAAVGVVFACACGAGVPVVTVESDHWTRAGGGVGVRKGRRLGVLASASSYTGASDRGGDMGDAISLGAWYAWRRGREPASACVLQLPEPKGAGARRFASDTVESGPDGPRPVRAR